MNTQMDKMTKLFLYITSFSFILILIGTGYVFLYKKDYHFFVEAACNPETDNCFVRDCSEADSCPPNNLENYRVFYVKAYDFKKCEADSCLSKCVSGEIICEELVCGDDPEDNCFVKEKTDELIIDSTEISTSTEDNTEIQ